MTCVSQTGLQEKFLHLSTVVQCFDLLLFCPNPHLCTCSPCCAIVFCTSQHLSCSSPALAWALLPRQCLVPFWVILAFWFSVWLRLNWALFLSSWGLWLLTLAWLDIRFLTLASGHCLSWLWPQVQGTRSWSGWVSYSHVCKSDILHTACSLAYKDQPRPIVGGPDCCLKGFQNRFKKPQGVSADSSNCFPCSSQVLLPERFGEE